MGRDNFELFVMVKPVYGYDVRGSETKKRIEAVPMQRLRDPGDCLEEGTAKVWRTAVSYLLKLVKDALGRLFRLKKTYLAHQGLY